MSKFFAFDHSNDDAFLIVGPEKDVTDYAAGDRQDALCDEIKTLLPLLHEEMENTYSFDEAMSEDAIRAALTENGWVEGECRTDDEDD